MEISNDELAGPFFKKIYKARFEKLGPHPFCKKCLKMNICMVANVPGYDFQCSERVDVGGGDPLPAPQPRKTRKHGGWK